MAERVLIDRDLAESTLTLKDATEVMELRRERAECEKKIKAMHESYTNRRKVHDDRIDMIDAQIATLMVSDTAGQ